MASYVHFKQLVVVECVSILSTSCCVARGGPPDILYDCTRTSKTEVAMHYKKQKVMILIYQT